MRWQPSEFRGRFLLVFLLLFTCPVRYCDSQPNFNVSILCTFVQHHIIYLLHTNASHYSHHIYRVCCITGYRPKNIHKIIDNAPRKQWSLFKQISTQKKKSTFGKRAEEKKRAPRKWRSNEKETRGQHSAWKSVSKTISINLLLKDVEEHSNTNVWRVCVYVSGTHGEQQRTAMWIDTPLFSRMLVCILKLKRMKAKEKTLISLARAHTQKKRMSSK